jgi:colicin import membrane protein
MATPTAYPTLRNAAVVLACAALSACSYVLLPANVQHVAPTSKSLAEADRKLADAIARRTAIEAEFAASEQVCYTKFFVNSCLEKAKEKRREALAVVRSVEVEAELYQRRDKAEARDRALAESQKEFEADAAQRAANPRPERVVEPAPEPKPPAAPSNRAAENAAKLKRIADKEQAEAGQRARNAANFEKKRLEAERREAERRKRQSERDVDNK